MMPNIESVAAYQLTINEQGMPIQISGEPFDSEAYSRMKHGVITDTQTFAGKLADTLCEEMPELVYGDMAPAFVEAYESLPHAATMLARFCLMTINSERLRSGLVPGDTLRIHTTDYLEPYSHRSLVEREQILRNQTGVVHDSLNERRPVIIDDIRVTGSQERWFYDILSPHTDGPIMAAYVASFPDSGSRQPELEGSLDDASIATLGDLLPYIAEGKVVVTHKLVRDLLLCPPDELPYFLERMPDSIKETVARGIASMDDDTLSPYQINCQTIFDSCAASR